MKNHYCVLDVETGGMSCKENPITQVAYTMLEPEKFKVVHNFEAFVKPYANLKILKEALEHSRVTMKEIEAGIDFKAVVAKIIEGIKIANKSGREQSRPFLVGHNVNFDIGFIVALFTLAGKNAWDYFDPIPICTMRLMKQMEVGKLKSDDVSRYTLTSCCERFGIKLKSAHGARQDVNVTVELLKRLILMLRQGKVESPTDLKETTPKSRNFFKFVEI